MPSDATHLASRERTGRSVTVSVVLIRSSRSRRAARARSIARGWNLIDAASTLLERSGGDDFTVQDVADEAGQSLRTLYQYFASKDDLLLAVFEEAMQAYATLVSEAVAPLEAPLDRLAGALLAALRLPATATAATTRGMMRVRLRLTQVQPAQMARAQQPIADLLRDLVAEAAAARAVCATDPGGVAFLLLSLNEATITTRTLGSDQGPGPTDDVQVVTFCLRGLGAAVEPGRLEALAGELRLPAGPVSVVTPYLSS